MHYDETQAGMNMGRILVASWAPQQEDRPGSLPTAMQRTDVREIEPGLADLQLDPRLVNGRHGSWNGWCSLVSTWPVRSRQGDNSGRPRRLTPHG
eukprot:13830147-Alexandrium_andersonii.AAC.1